MESQDVGIGARIAAFSALVLLVAMSAFGWFRIDSVRAEDRQGHVYVHPGSQLIDVTNESGSDVSADAWKAFSAIDIVLALVVVGGLALAAVRSRGRSALASALAIGVAGVGGLALLLLVFRVISPPDLLAAFGIAKPENVSLDADIGRETGIWIGIAACAGVTFGAIRVATEARSD